MLEVLVLKTGIRHLHILRFLEVLSFDLKMITSEDESKEKMVDKACDSLSEHFDSVRIMVTFHSGDGSRNTKSYTVGSGNFYSQVGFCKEWLIRQDEYVRCNARKHDQSDEI